MNYLNKFIPFKRTTFFLLKNSWIFILFFIMLSFYQSTQATNRTLNLVVGKYECTKNADCVSKGDDYHCDIDDHACKKANDCEVCEICPDCPDCPTCPETPACPEAPACPEIPTLTCSEGEHLLDGQCVECVSNADCKEQKKPFCGPGNFKCGSCPADKPYWYAGLNICTGCLTDENCIAKKKLCRTTDFTCQSCYDIFNADKPYWTGSGCGPCPTAKPYWFTDKKSCVACYSDMHCSSAKKVCRSSDNTCQLCHVVNGAAKPYWNGSKCAPCPTKTPLWNETLKECKACLADSDCVKTKNACRVSDGSCQSCYTVYGPAKPYWDGTKCAACPFKTPAWDTTTNTCGCPANQYMIDGQCRKCEQKALRVVGGNNECQIANLETIGSGWSCGFSRDNSRSGTIIAEGYFIAQDTGTYYFGPLHGGNNKYGNIDYLYLDIDGKRVFSTNGNNTNNVSVRLEKGAHKLRYEAHVHKRTSIQFNYNTGSLCYPCDASSLYKNGKCVCRPGYKDKNGTCVKETVCRNDDNNKVQRVSIRVRWIWNGSSIAFTSRATTSVDVGEYHYTTDGNGKICRSGR